MTPRLIFIYLTCSSAEQDKMIGTKLLEKRLIACFNLLGEIESKYWWPARAGKLESAHEVVVLLKTIPDKLNEVEKEVKSLQDYEMSCLCAIPIFQVNEEYAQWVKNELEENPDAPG